MGNRNLTKEQMEEELERWRKDDSRGAAVEEVKLQGETEKVDSSPITASSGVSDK